MQTQILQQDERDTHKFVIPVRHVFLFLLSPSLPPSTFGGQLRKFIPRVPRCHAFTTKTFAKLELYILLLQVGPK